jgi:hypothetical protein
MIEAILFAKFTTIIFVCIMSFLIGIMLGIGIGKNDTNMGKNDIND